MTAASTVLAVNAGSSSLKFAVFTGTDRAPALAGKLTGIGVAPELAVRDAAGRTVSKRRWSDGAALSHEQLLDALLGALEEQGEIGALDAVSHRIVHGGTRLSAPVRISPALLDALDALCPLAPLHQPHNIAPIRAIAARRPHLPQVACFDTGFHHDMPAVATRFALPRRFDEAGVRRFGFHGLSYEFVATRLREINPAFAGGRTIAAHLGNGASLCAMLEGRSIDTTMGFSVLDGLVMGTRCGTLDPGVLLYLLRHDGMTAEEVERLLYDQSGLLGVSGLSSDMRTLLASDDPRAGEAVALFVYRAAREAGALAAALGGLDTLVFTGGIGENSAAIRLLICRRLAWLGIEVDAAANDAAAALISTPASRVAVRVIPANEEWMLADHARRLLASPARP